MKIFTTNIKEDALEDNYFRKVLFTSKSSQLVLMSLKPGEDIGEEVHKVDQTLIFVEGHGKAKLDGDEYEIKPNSIFCVPAGTKHNFINSEDGYMKLYTIYAPAEHKEGAIHKTKEDAEKAEESGEDHPQA